MQKTLLQTNVSELYQEILQPEENGCLPNVQDEYDNEILSDTVLIYLMPLQIRKKPNVTKSHVAVKHVFTQEVYMHHCYYGEK